MNYLLVLDYSSQFLFFVDKNQRDQDWRGFLTEGHGMLWDIVFFGILLTFYERLRDKRELKQRNEYEKKEALQKKETEKQDKISRYLEEIDDLRGWQSQEAVFRIVGNLKRLNSLGITEINLDECYLKNARLTEINLKGSSFRNANLVNADFENAILDNTNWSFSKIEGAIFRKAEMNFSSIEDIENCSKTDFTQAKFKNTQFINVNATNARFWSSNFGRTTLNGVILENCDLLRANFFKCCFLNVNLKNAKIFQYQQQIMKTYLANTDKMNILENPSDFETNKDTYLMNN